MEEEKVKFKTILIMTVLVPVDDKDNIIEKGKKATYSLFSFSQFTV